MANRWGNNGNSDRLYFGGLQNHCRWWVQPRNSKTLALLKESYDKTRQHIKKQRHYFADKGLSGQGYGFSSSHVWMWELDYKESWVPENWCFWTVVLEKTLESPFAAISLQTARKSNQWILKEISPEAHWLKHARLSSPSQTPRRKRLLILWLQLPSAVILKPRKIKSLTVSIISPSICHEVMGLDASLDMRWCKDWDHRICS